MDPKLSRTCVLWLLWLTTLSTADQMRDEFNCPGPTNCSCSRSPHGASSYELNCPEFLLRPASLTVHIKLNELVQVQCINTDNPDVFSLLNGLEIGSIEKFILRLCPLPKTSVKELMNSIGLKNVKTLQIQSYSNLSNTLMRKHLEDLDDIINLRLDMNGLTTLPEDIFQDMGNLVWLDLQSNQIQFPKGIFRHVPKLEVLELGNNNLTHLEPGLFRNLTHLRLLNLWANRLTNLTRSVFTDVPNLERLDLSTNHMTAIRPDLFIDLVHLKSLNLYKNEFVSLPKGLLLANSELEIFYIHENERTLKTLPSGLLANLTKLQIVKMKGCNLTSLPEDLLWGSSIINLTLARNLLQTLPEKLFSKSSELVKLDLGYNKINHLPEKLFETNIKLKELMLDRNLLQTLPENLFNKLKNLEYLDLRYNKIAYFKEFTFSGLTGLKTLNLSDNQLTFEDKERYQIDPFELRSPLQFCIKMEDLQLANNSIKTVFDDWRTGMSALRKLNLAYNKISMLNFDHMNLATSHNVILDVSFNNINTINMIFAEKISQIQLKNVHPIERDQQRTIQVKINGNPLHCDCQLYDLVRYFEGGLAPEVKFLFEIEAGDVKCVEPKLFRGSPLKTVPSALLTCQINSSSCPAHCECHYRIADKAMVINCERADIDEIPDLTDLVLNEDLVYNITNHTEVYLSYNRIHHLPPKLGIGYDRVTKYLLAENNIFYINLTTLSPDLQVLDLSGNNLTYLDVDSLDFLDKAKHLQNVTLYNNPWQCDCSSMPFVYFLQAHIKQVSSFNNITCPDGLPIVQLSSSDVCQISGYIIIGTSAVIAVLGFIMGALVAAYYRYQREIKVWLYAHGYCLWFVSEEELDQDKIFDAFVSYSHQDEDFVVDHLVPGLENGPIKFKLCLHYRDWIVGEFIPNQIARSVEDSRRTVVILSPNFLESIWGRMEFRTAHSQALSEGRARVIIILYGDIGPTDNLDPELKAYLSMNTYVKWGDPWFWDKLRYALPHPPGLAKEIPLIKPNAKKSKPVLNLTDKSGLMNGTDPNASPPAVTTPPATSIIIDPLEKTNGHIKTIS